MPRPKKQVESKFSITLRIGNDTYTGTGDTALEALQNVQPPVKLFQKGVITISDGEKSKEMFMMPAKLKRIFYPSAQPFLIKYLAAGLK